MRAKDFVPGNRTLVREVIVKSAEAGKIDRHESVLGAGGVTSGKAVAVREDVVQAGCALIVGVVFATHIKIVVAIHARANH